MAEKLQWQDSWSVGNQTLDDDHKRLIDIIGRIEDYRPASADLGQLFAELEDYTRYHFSREEDLMDGADIEDLEGHKKFHRDFEEWLHSVRYTMSVSRESREFLLDSVDEYLRKWLVHHILETDMNYRGVI